MKTTILKLALFGFIGGAVMVSCNSPEQKVANANEGVTEAKAGMVEADKALAQAKLDSAADYATFKKDEEIKLKENEVKIAQLKAELKTEKKEIQEKKEKEIAALQEKNETMKTRMNEFKAGASDKWAAFKLGFNKDMDELGKSISSMAENNMKKN
jgi:molybdopterin converting factor small subunit